MHFGLGESIFNAIYEFTEKCIKWDGHLTRIHSTGFRFSKLGI